MTDDAPPTDLSAGGSVAEQIRRSMEELTPAERRVGRALLAEYPVAGLSTVAELAERATTSPATVVRLVQKLGFDYPTFQAALRDELSVRRTGPIERLRRADPEWKQEGLLARVAATLAELAESVSSTVPQAEFEAAVKLLGDNSGHAYLAGGRVTNVLAEYLEAHLSRFRRGVTVLPQHPARRAANVLDIARRDLLVAFDFRRYEQETVELVNMFRDRGARVILVTDVLLSPAASRATIVLPVQVETPSPFDTAVPGMVIVEALALATLPALDQDGLERMRAWDAMVERGLLED